MISFNEYQEGAFSTALYPNKRNNFIYPTLGLVGEAGEVAEKIKKIIRDDKSIINDEKKKEIEKELGDVLWYIAALCTELHLNMEDVAFKNLQKLFSRKDRNKIHGEGDNR